MGCSFSKQPIPSVLPAWTNNPPSTIIRGAGCLFLTETHALAGFHSKRKAASTIRICGFGGMTEEDEPWWQTAFRETIEELFEPTSAISFNIYHHLAAHMKPRKVIYDAECAYIVLVYDFADLTSFLTICASYIISPLYDTFPMSWESLIFNRQYVGKMEITDIVLWPRKNEHTNFHVTRELLRDLSGLQELDEIQYLEPPEGLRCVVYV